MLSINGEIVWQPVCEKRVDILSTHSKNSSLGLVLAVDGVELNTLTVGFCCVCFKIFSGSVDTQLW